MTRHCFDAFCLAIWNSVGNEVSWPESTTHMRRHEQIHHPSMVDMYGGHISSYFSWGILSWFSRYLWLLWFHTTWVFPEVMGYGWIAHWNLTFVRMLVMSCQEGDRLTRCGELKVTVQVEGLAPCGFVATVVSKRGWWGESHLVSKPRRVVSKPRRCKNLNLPNKKLMTTLPIH